MKLITDGTATGSGPSNYPTSFIDVYRCAGADAIWADLAGTPRTPASRLDWPGPFNANGEAEVSSSVSNYNFPTGLTVLGDGLTIENFEAPYVRALQGVTFSPNTFKYGTIGRRVGGIYPGYIPNSLGQDANLKCVNAVFDNCEIFSGVDLIRLTGNIGDLLQLNQCWLHDLQKLESSPGQGGGDSHSDTSQMNPYSSYASSNILFYECRVDAYLVYMDSGGTEHNQGATYNHSTGVFTPGDLWHVDDPSSNIGGFLTKYETLATVSLYGATGAPSGDVKLEKVYIDGHAYRLFSFTDGFAPGRFLSCKDLVIYRKDSSWASTWEGYNYTVRQHGGYNASVWSNVLDQYGNPVAATD